MVSAQLCPKNVYHRLIGMVTHVRLSIKNVLKEHSIKVIDVSLLSHVKLATNGTKRPSSVDVQLEVLKLAKNALNVSIIWYIFQTKDANALQVLSTLGHTVNKSKTTAVAMFRTLIGLIKNVCVDQDSPKEDTNVSVKEFK